MIFVNISLLSSLIEEKEKKELIYEKKWIFQILNGNKDNHLVQLMSEILNIIFLKFQKNGQWLKSKNFNFDLLVTLLLKNLDIEIVRLDACYQFFIDFPKKNPSQILESALYHNIDCLHRHTLYRQYE
ncbi:hypothetical protein BpHYR1_036450 [Brachionus plicatilis]|uniref:Uncharacterized protein n=1 Tax=Brachionus plicatilis TaxID=10195 RepID=A0A3M7QWA3_BRAPC|nr:hypothetical protein BpHYR1_036450 [Brachionus plicatilis]